MRIQRKHFGPFNIIPQKYGLMYTGHHRTLAKVSNCILTGLTDQGKAWFTIFYKIFSSFEVNHT